MKPHVLFVERKASSSVSIERVFRQIASDLPAGEFETSFQAVPYGNGIGAIIKNLLFFRPQPADIYHVTGDAYYIALRLPSERLVLTIHDLIFLHRRTGLRRFVLKKLFLDLPLSRAARVTVVSDAIRDEILLYAPEAGNKISVIENPLIGKLEPGDIKPFDERSPVVLHIGTAVNKNLGRLVAALRDISCRLRIIGHLDDKMVSELETGNVAYENKWDLDEKAIAGEYRQCDIVSFCSTYEGFGLPIIEAQAMHKPVLTSDRPPMSAVAGGGAHLVDPDDVASIRAGLIKLINDREYRISLIEAGLRNIGRFSGVHIAQRYAAIYRQLTEGVHRPGR